MDVFMVSPHFSRLELGLSAFDEDSPEVSNYVNLCDLIMEPIREKFGPLIVTSGYRDPVHNKEVGGKNASWHQAEDGKAAIDFKPFASRLLVRIFDWLRLESHLPFDEIILEFDHLDTQTPIVIHVQYSDKNPPRRLAFEGFTGAGVSYTGVTVNA